MSQVASIDPRILAALAAAQQPQQSDQQPQPDQQPTSPQYRLADDQSAVARGPHLGGDYHPQGSSGTSPQGGRGSGLAGYLNQSRQSGIDTRELDDAKGQMTDEDYQRARDYAQSSGATQNQFSDMIDKGISRKTEADRFAKEQAERYGVAANTSGLTGQTSGAQSDKSWNIDESRGQPGSADYRESITNFQRNPDNTYAPPTFGYQGPQAANEQQNTSPIPGISAADWQRIPIADRARMTVENQNRQSSNAMAQWRTNVQGINDKIRDANAAQRSHRAEFDKLNDSPFPSAAAQKRLDDLKPLLQQDDETIQNLTGQRDKAFGSFPGAETPAAPVAPSAAPAVQPTATDQGKAATDSANRVALALPAQTMMDRLRLHSHAIPINEQTRFAMGNLYKSAKGRVHQMVGTDEQGRPMFSQPLA